MARFALLFVLFVAPLAGCASRLERSRALASAIVPEPARERVAGTAEGVRARAVRLSLPGAVLRAAPPPPAVVFVPVAVPAPSCGPIPPDYGPTGDVGVSSTAGYAVAYGSYLAPGGAVPPGLRPAFDPAPARPAPSAAPYAAAFPAGDVITHRPGLSVGAGVFGRTR